MQLKLFSTNKKSHSFPLQGPSFPLWGLVSLDGFQPMSRLREAPGRLALGPRRLAADALWTAAVRTKHRFRTGNGVVTKRTDLRKPLKTQQLRSRILNMAVPFTPRTRPRGRDGPDHLRVVSPGQRPRDRLSMFPARFFFASLRVRLRSLSCLLSLY